MLCESQHKYSSDTELKERRVLRASAFREKEEDEPLPADQFIKFHHFIQSLEMFQLHADPEEPSCFLSLRFYSRCN